MPDYPDHQERPPPFENIITVFPANVAAYKSTAVHVDNTGGAAATVRATWYMHDAPTVSTHEDKTVDAGAATTLFFVNQGDTLDSVTVTGGGGGTTHAVSESNQLPLPASGAGIAFDTDNEGGWLYVQTNDPTEAGGSIHGYALDLQDRSGAFNGIRLQTFGAMRLEAAASHTILAHTGNLTIETDQDDGAGPLGPVYENLVLRADLTSIGIRSGKAVVISSGVGTTNCNIIMSEAGEISFTANSITMISGAGGMVVGQAPTDLVGFFGATPAAQPGHPTTLGDVITALVTLGLVAP